MCRFTHQSFGRVRFQRGEQRRGDLDDMAENRHRPVSQVLRLTHPCRVVRAPLRAWSWISLGPCGHGMRCQMRLCRSNASSSGASRISVVATAPGEGTIRAASCRSHLHSRSAEWLAAPITSGSVLNSTPVGRWYSQDVSPTNEVNSTPPSAAIVLAGFKVHRSTAPVGVPPIPSRR